jgi:transcriptional regulator with XRE-family HTH domain
MDKYPGSSDHNRLDLGSALRSRRRKRGMSLRDLQNETGVSFNTLSRVERGFVPDLRNYERIVQWLGLPSGAFLSGVSEGKTDNTPTPTVIAQHLFADRHLSASDASAIAELVGEMYKQLAVERPSLTVHLRSSQTFRKEAGNLLAEMLHEMQAALESER